MTRTGRKILTNRVLNLLLYLIVSFLLGTGLLIWLRLPPGSRGGHGLTVLGWGRHDWGDLHKYVALSFAAFTILHLLLNWKWMVKIAGYNRAWPLWLGLATGVGIIGFFFVIPVASS